MIRLLKMIIRWLEHKKELSHNVNSYWLQKKSEQEWYNKWEVDR